MDTQEGNKLIAEFMGVETYFWQGQLKQKNPPKTEWNGEEYEDAMVLYHHSWDWLMPVVEKIERLSPNDRIFIEIVNGKGWANLGMYGYAEDDSLIKATWKACTKFIKWYNKEK